MLSVHESCPVCTPDPAVVLVHTPKPDVVAGRESALGEILSQSELQMLQHMMAQYIRTHEQVRKEFKEEALSYPVGDEMRNMLFREHREIKAKLKKLSTLQYRLKHKIATRG